MAIGVALFVLGLALGDQVLPSMLAEALNDAKQVMSGGNSGTASSLRYTGPGVGNIYTADFPATDLGEQAAQVRCPREPSASSGSRS